MLKVQHFISVAHSLNSITGIELLNDFGNFLIVPKLIALT